MAPEAATAELLTDQELMARVGLKKSRFYELKAQKAWKFLETARPVCGRRYAKVLVDRYLAGESVSQFGQRRA